MLRFIEISDKRLVQQVLAGRPDRFGPLVDRHQAMVHAVALAQTGNFADAEDVVQDAFIKAYESLPSLRDPSRFGPWVATIARRAAFSRLKERQQQPRLRANDADTTVAPMVEDREMEELLRREMDQLEPDQREILLLRYYAGKSVKEVARAFDLKPAAAAKRLQRAREALGARLVTTLGESREDEDRARGRVARVMGVIAVAQVSWQASAAAATTFGLGSLASAKALVGLVAIACVAVGTWSYVNRETAPSDDSQPIEVATNAVPVEAIASSDADGDSARAATSQAVPDDTPAVVATDDRGAITGRVYERETGLGVAGAEIRVSPKPYREELGGLVAVTDDSGVYRLDNLEPWEYDLRPRRVEGYSDRVTWSSRIVAVGAGAAVEGVDFALISGCQIRGRVVDRNGAPLSPGSVRAWTPDNSNEGSGTMEKDGSFVVGGVPETNRVFVQPVKSGYALAPQGPFELPPEGIDGLVLTMDPEATLSGVLIDGNGDPLEGVRVSPSPGPGQCSGISTEPSNAEGRFKVYGLFAGSYRISVGFPGENMYRRLEDYAPIPIATGEHIEGVELVCDFAPQHPFAIAGSVRNTSGAPIRGVDVVADRPGWHETKTGRDGAFHIEDLQDADYRLYIWHRDYAPQRLQTVPASQDDLNIVLESRGRIEGQVIDSATGVPVPNFEILEHTRRNQYNGRASYVRVSQVEGRFSLKGVEPGDRTVLVRAEGYAPTSSEPVQVRPGEASQGLVVRLNAGRTVEGVVLDPEGQPAREARIFLNDQPVTGFVLMDYALAVTGADGRFTLDSVPADATRVVAWHPRHAAAHAPIPGSTGPAQVEIRLRSGGTLQGTVRAEGEPIPNLNVSIGDTSWGLRVSQTNEAGEYTIIGLNSGVVDVVANPTFGDRANWYGRKQVVSVEVREGTTTTFDLEFDLWTTEVRGRITVNGESPRLDGCYLYLKYDDTPGFSDMFYTRTDGDGYFRLDGARPGPALLEIIGDAIVSRQRPALTVHIGPNGATDLNLDIDTSAGSEITPTITILE